MRKLDDFECLNSNIPMKSYQLYETLNTNSKYMLVKNLGTDNYIGNSSTLWYQFRDLKVIPEMCGMCRGHFRLSESPLNNS